MPATTIGPHKFRKILYDPLERNTLGITVRSDRSINVHTVPATELDRFREDKSFHGSTFMRVKNLNIRFNSGQEFENEWYLILENKSDYEADVEYDVFER